MLQFSIAVLLGLLCCLLNMELDNALLLGRATLHSRNAQVPAQHSLMVRQSLKANNKESFALFSRTIEKSSAEFVHDLFGLTGKVAIVSGSTGGLGYSMAKTLLQCGAQVVINGRR